MNSSALGCKRITFDTDYLPALHRDNVERNCDGIDSIVKNGVLTQKGEFLLFVHLSSVLTSRRRSVEFRCHHICHGVRHSTSMLTAVLRVADNLFEKDRYPLVVQGTDGQTVQDYHDKQGGPVAYLGTTMPGFPNFYMISGMLMTFLCYCFTHARIETRRS
jgi:cation diffusion facilitator CzcD-associated flavoprotein CzcO